MLPLAAPPLGVNVAVNVTLSLAVSVSGKVSPLIEKAAPVTFACEMVTADPPTLVKVSERLLLLPTAILPNPRLAGSGDRAPGETEAPAPERSSTTVPFTWLEVVAKVTLPVKLPFDGGANLTVAEVESPACNVSGRDRSLNAKPAPLNVAWVMLRSLAPLLESVTVVLWLDPTA